MLSILIPIYNQDIRPLVYTLSKQCIKANINYQILCFDDGSDVKWKEKNNELAFKFNINYTEMSENLGRSRIRNWLGKGAYYENLLFLDCDSTIPNKNFIQNYLDHLPAEHIIYGGTVYKKKAPTSKRKYLHWLYGTKMEALPANKRNKHPFRHFHTNNFLMPASVFNAYKFNEEIVGYGYEDLLYAANLSNHKVNILHIDNPVIHDGLEYNDKFLAKTKEATENLAILYHNHMLTDTKLTRTYEFLIKYKLKDIFVKTFEKQFSSRVKSNLLSEKPSLKYLQFWKLFTFIESIEKIKSNTKE